MKTPDNYRFLIVATYNSGRCAVLFSTNNEEALTVASCEAFDLYAEEIKNGKIRIDTYKTY